MRTVSGKQMCRALESRGWVRDRVRGSHHVFLHPTLPGRVVVPVHSNQDLKPGTQGGIMKAAGISDAEL